MIDSEAHMLRRTITVLLFLIALFLPVAVAAPPASANGYDLHACDATWSSPANNAFAAVADPGMTAYSECPAGKGMVVRNVYDGGTTSAFQGAYLILDAPTGTSIGSIDFDAGYQRHDCSYNVALVASGPDLGGHDVWGTGPGQGCDSFETPGEGNFFPNRWSASVGPAGCGWKSVVGRRRVPAAASRRFVCATSSCT
ncbi:hypothetical protein NBH00_07990 [Paraconexibacter antarcticus]|uniref:Uncharacterized protein n=1 Tax=Paraconexibacter antarcticus TaxID=2949664 RepID=A0ABY5DZU0_9ACTN|nr:hypothetical protein [Paraconexibacter antarcticus]UTI66132.1 hypothetical protein NBH00_07990 [Paraconexibacter antarcticus]